MLWLGQGLGFFMEGVSEILNLLALCSSSRVDCFDVLMVCSWGLMFSSGCIRCCIIRSVVEQSCERYSGCRGKLYHGTETWGGDCAHRILSCQQQYGLLLLSPGLQAHSVHLIWNLKTVGG